MMGGSFDGETRPREALIDSVGGPAAETNRLSVALAWP